MKKFTKFLLPTCLAGVVALSGSCDTADKNQDALIQTLNSSPRGLVADVPAFPYTLMDGEEIQFTSSSTNRPNGPLGNFTVVSADNLREVRSGNASLAPASEDAYLWLFLPDGLRNDDGNVQSSIPRALLSITDHTSDYQNQLSGLDIPEQFETIIGTSKNPGSLFNAYAEHYCGRSTTPDELNNEVRKALASIGWWTLLDPNFTEGPVVRISQFLSLRVTSSDLTATPPTISGNYQYSETFYTVEAFGSASINLETEGSCVDQLEFDGKWVPDPAAPAMPRAHSYTDAGSFTIKLNALESISTNLP